MVINSSQLAKILEKIRKKSKNENDEILQIDSDIESDIFIYPPLDEP